MATEYAVEMLNITKEFSGFKANDNITLQLKAGEIHALLGENGAGKSTLMGVLFGMYSPTSGIIKVNGEEVKITNPNVADKLGIGMVHQHFKLVECFSVLDNVILGVEPCKHGILKKDEARKKLVELSTKYGLEVDPDAIISDISVGMQQRVEILKMLYRDNDILILDEPTAVLTPQEISELLDIMRRFAKEGKSILFISHKLNEIMEVADRCTIIRKGKYINTVNVSDINEDELSAMVVGRTVSLGVSKVKSEPKDVVLSVRNLTVESKTEGAHGVKDASLYVRGGEIVCIAGIDGNGQSELIYAITGLLPVKSGTISLNGTEITNTSVRCRNELGIGHIPEDRLKYGIIEEYSLGYNMIMQKYFTSDFSDRCGFLREEKIGEFTEKMISQYDIRCSNGIDTLIGTMSGGNQQKAVIAREVIKNPSIIIAVQPIRGLDVGAIEYIHNELIRERDEGKAVLIVSFELSEVMSMADRILVMYDGQIAGEFDPNDVTAEELGLCMIGGKHE